MPGCMEGLLNPIMLLGPPSACMPPVTRLSESCSLGAVLTWQENAGDRTHADCPSYRLGACTKAAATTACSAVGNATPRVESP